MLIIALNGSPNKNGNTAFLLQEAMEVIRSQGAETKIFNLAEAVADAKHPFCICCSTPCSGVCYKGTMLEQMFNDLRQADGIICGSPVYFGTASAQMKAFWDKTRALRKDKALIDVVGASITSGSSRFGGQESAARAMHEIMLTHGMTVVGDGYYADDAGHQAACAQRPVSQDQEGIKRTRILAKRVVDLARATAEMRANNRNK
ncbi:flavodoxin family protein [Desulfofalx alkaliphila]|uniref:flavodoxin family protein n=1 Tax=Desulfofalx alkaliphila TaxID=105483 RepID=UPI0004E18C4F|nr:flavodoxin family protein [Desulfofalx alkaliphila]